MGVGEGDEGEFNTMELKGGGIVVGIGIVHRVLLVVAFLNSKPNRIQTTGHLLHPLKILLFLASVGARLLVNVRTWVPRAGSDDRRRPCRHAQP